MPRDAFWDDLRKDLENTEFWDAYAAATERIQKRDTAENAKRERAE